MESSSSNRKHSKNNVVIGVGNIGVSGGNAFKMINICSQILMMSLTVG